MKMMLFGETNQLTAWVTHVEKSTKNNKIPNEQPAFGCQPAFGSHSQSLYINTQHSSLFHETIKTWIFGNIWFVNVLFHIGTVGHTFTNSGDLNNNRLDAKWSGIWQGAASLTVTAKSSWRRHFFSMTSGVIVINRYLWYHSSPLSTFVLICRHHHFFILLAFKMSF